MDDLNNELNQLTEAYQSNRQWNMKPAVAAINEAKRRGDTEGEQKWNHTLAKWISRDRSLALQISQVKLKIADVKKRATR